VLSQHPPSRAWGARRSRVRRDVLSQATVLPPGFAGANPRRPKPVIEATVPATSVATVSSAAVLSPRAQTVGQRVWRGPGPPRWVRANRPGAHAACRRTPFGVGRAVTKRAARGRRGFAPAKPGAVACNCAFLGLPSGAQVTPTRCSCPSGASAGRRAVRPRLPSGVNLGRPRARPIGMPDGTGARVPPPCRSSGTAVTVGCPRGAPPLCRAVLQAVSLREAPRYLREGAAT